LLDSDAGIIALTQGQMSLNYLSLRKLPLLTHVAVQHVRSASLKTIDFRWIEGFDDRTIEQLVLNNRNLRHVHLMHCYSITDRCLITVARTLTEQLVRL
jgi:hypothetical protein